MELRDIQTARTNCQRFANDHKLIFEDRGEVGFGRSCVGFVRGTGYIDINPHKADGTYEEVWLRDERLYAPGDVEAYHKHDCLVVLVNGDDYDTAIRQLDAWVCSLEAQGQLQVESFSTGATGVQVLFSGAVGYALRFKNPVMA